MKRLILALVVMITASASAQAQMGYTQNPIWQTPVYYQHPYYYGGYGGYGGINSFQSGNFNYFYGTGELRGFRGYSQRVGGYRQLRYSYGW